MFEDTACSVMGVMLLHTFTNKMIKSEESETSVQLIENNLISPLPAAATLASTVLYERTHSPLAIQFVITLRST